MSAILKSEQWEVAENLYANVVHYNTQDSKLFTDHNLAVNNFSFVYTDSVYI